MQYNSLKYFTKLKSDTRKQETQNQTYEAYGTAPSAKQKIFKSPDHNPLESQIQFFSANTVNFVLSCNIKIVLIYLLYVNMAKVKPLQLKNLLNKKHIYILYNVKENNRKKHLK